MKRYKKTDMIKDLEHLLGTIKNVHPNLYYNTNEKEFDSLVSKIKLNSEDDMSENEIYKMFGKLIASLNDGHTTCFPSKSYSDYISSDGTFFPFDLSITKKRVFVKNVYADSFPDEKVEILSINDIKIKTIVENMLDYVSGEDTNLKTEFLSSYFRAYLWILYGFQNEYTIKYLLDEKIYEDKVVGIKYDTLIGKTSDTRNDKYNHKMIDDKYLAILELNEFGDYENFKEYINKFFLDIQNKKIENLIIDLRNNGGGDSRVGDEIFKYIIQSPFRQFSSVNIKVSEEIKEYYRTDQYIRDYYKTYNPEILDLIESKENGDVIEVEGDFIKPYDNLNFKGNVFLITSCKTYSSASSFTTTFHDYEVGKILGDSPGGFANSYGDLYMFELPNSKFEITVSHKFHIRPNKDRALKKIGPDLVLGKNINKTEDLIAIIEKL